MLAMTAPWLDSKTPVGPPTAADPTIRNLLYAAVVTGGWSSLLCLVIFFVGRLFGVPFELVSVGEAHISNLTWLVVLLVPLAAAVAGALLASLLRGRRHAGRIVFWVGTLLALASCLWPILQPADVYWSTRILLLLMHAITWLLVVPQIARIIGDSEPDNHVERNG
jgi:Family of unknown function (DUF6069)